MTQFSIDELRGSLDDIVRNVASTGEPVILASDGERVAAIISIEALTLLESIEDKLDLIDGLVALAEHRASGEQTIAIEDAARELGLEYILRDTNTT